MTSRKRHGRKPVPQMRLSDESPSDTVWGMSRAGAHAATGFAYQDLVAASLLLGSAGMPEVAVLTPEGDSDLDVALLVPWQATESETPVRRVYIEAKRRKEMKYSALVEAAVSAFRQARHRGSDAHAAVVTDAPNMEALAPCGWSVTLASAEGRAAENLRSAFTDKLPADQVSDLLARTHLVIVRPTLESLAQTIAHRKHLSSHLIARHVAARLIVSVRESVALQRATNRASAATLTANDVELLLANASSFDTTLLHDVERKGLASWVDLKRASTLTRAGYLRGITSDPAASTRHSLPRPSREAGIARALDKPQPIVLIGPSGSGKTTLMWNVANQQTGRARVLWLHRSPLEDLGILRRFLDELAKDESSVLLICADDIGDPNHSGYSELCSFYQFHPRIRFLATCREETFQLNLLPAGGRTFSLTLDEGEAIELGDAAIEESLVSGDITRDELVQHWRDSDGLLMEFMCLLVEEHTLEEILARQAEALLRSSTNHPDLRLLRAVVTADILGVPLPWEGAAVLCKGDVDATVSRLKGEFIVVNERTANISGLHRLRSRRLFNLLHRDAPSLDTVRSVLPLLNSADLPRGLVAALKIAPEGVQEYLRLFRKGIHSDDLALRNELILSLPTAHAVVLAAQASTQIARLRVEYEGTDSDDGWKQGLETDVETILRTWGGESFTFERAITRFAKEAHAFGTKRRLISLSMRTASLLGIMAQLGKPDRRLLVLMRDLPSSYLAQVIQDQRSYFSIPAWLSLLANTDCLSSEQVDGIAAFLHNDLTPAECVAIAAIGSDAGHAVSGLLGSLAERFVWLERHYGLAHHAMGDTAQVQFQLTSPTPNKKLFATQAISAAVAALAVFPETVDCLVFSHDGGKAVRLNRKIANGRNAKSAGDLLVWAWRDRERSLTWSQWLVGLAHLTSSLVVLMEAVLAHGLTGVFDPNDSLEQLAMMRVRLGPPPVTEAGLDRFTKAPVVGPADYLVLDGLPETLAACEALCEVASGEWQASANYVVATREASGVAAEELRKAANVLDVFAETRAVVALRDCRRMVFRLRAARWRTLRHEPDLENIGAPGLLERVQAVDHLSLVARTSTDDVDVHLLERSSTRKGR